ncbi:MAG: ATP-binding protein [Xenococcus sp. MO_188.B8]|nr:ATP-binding protein [Xenococcus sp. MO_188.B8]
MFQKTRLQLTFAYVGVLTVILTGFTVAVRLIFTRSLNQQLTVRLENLATAATFNMDLEDGELDIDDDEILVGQEQAIQWFDLQGKLVAQQGEYQLNIPLEIEPSLQNHSHPYPIRSVTKPVKELEVGEAIGYVRVSESLTELHNTLSRLDYGLSSGVAIGILLSTIGGIWLTGKAMQPIESSFERLRQFTADASHELRSPLMAIKTNADVALKYPEGIRKTDVEKFKSISSASNQMTRLTENLLLLARTDKISQIEQKPINLSSLLADLIQLYKSQAEEKNLLWQANIAQDLYFLGDEGLLRQVFSNLLQNALHYTNAGDSVTLSASRTSSKLLIKVEDTGIGIAAEHLDRIFERFWRVDKSRSYQTGKSGLGLAIVREIVRQHHGEIAVSSKLGVGSCFTVSFSV